LPAPHSGLDALGNVAGLGEDGLFPRALVAADGQQNLCSCCPAGGGEEVLGVVTTKNSHRFLVRLFGRHGLAGGRAGGWRWGIR
jgi:hypothetical protein